jgi:DNA repair exonuclease SbcCD nuclease subunit/energy-coupling factor transporter ATP-binding protein EcfA2
MAKWLITGDWQVDFKNLDSCYRAHGNEMFLAKEKKVKGIIDLGDLKEVYDPISQRVTDFQIHRWQNIKKSGLEAAVLLGNHDRLGQYSEDRNWFSLFKALGVNAVETPRIIDYGSVVFACLPYIRSPKKLIRAAEKLWEKCSQHKRVKRVLLFHCDVREAQYGFGRPSSSTVSTRELRFHKYHYCFGGHIHAHQQLTKNSMYVGNPFCCDWGERDTLKGFVVYDDETNRVEFLKSSIPGWYSYQWLLEHKIKSVVKGTKIQDTVECSNTLDYHKQLEARRLEIKEKYPEALVYVKPEFAKGEESEVVVDIAATDKQKFSSYITAVGGKSILRKKDKILAYLQHVLGKVPFANVRSEEGVVFDKVKAENVLSFKDLEFSYRDRGVCVVEGINRDWPKHSNGAGKTNLLSMLPVAITGQTFRDQKTDDWINESIGKKAKVTLTSHDAKGRKLKIIRGRKPILLKFFIDGKDESTGLRHSGKRETQGIIEDTLGFDLDTLKSSVYIDASLPKAFLEGTQKVRTDIISRFQNLDRFEYARKIASKDLSKSRESIDNLEDEISIEEMNIKDLEEKLSSVREKAHKNIAGYKRGVTKHRVILREAKGQLKLYKKRNKKKIKRLTRRYDDLYVKQNTLAKQDYVVCDEIHKHKAFLASTSKDAVCPTCGQIIKATAKEHVRQAHKDEMSKLMKQHSDILAKTASYRSLLDILNSKKKILVRKQCYYEEKLSVAKGNYLSARAAYRAARRSSRVSTSLATKFEHNISEAKKKIERCKQAILDESSDANLLSFAVKAFSRDGIPLYLNGLSCPVLNRAADEYSQMFCDGEIQVRFDLKDGEFDSTIVNAHGSKEIKGQSTGEKAWAGFICSLALRELAPKTNLLILDEPGYGMDEESTKVLGVKLVALGSRFETVLVVSHNANIVAALQGDNTVVVEKKHRISRIVKESN